LAKSAEPRGTWRKSSLNAQNSYAAPVFDLFMQSINQLINIFISGITADCVGIS